VTRSASVLRLVAATSEYHPYTTFCGFILRLWGAQRQSRRSRRDSLGEQRVAGLDLSGAHCQHASVERFRWDLQELWNKAGTFSLQTLLILSCFTFGWDTAI